MNRNKREHFRQQVTLNILLAVVYFLTAQLGLHISPLEKFVAPIWPPAGISLAALLIYGSELWLGVAIGAFASNFFIGAPPLVACGMAVGNTLEAIIGSFFLRHICKFDPNLKTEKDVGCFIFYGALLSTLISATLGTSSLYLGNIIIGIDFLKTWVTWWLGDITSVVIFTPVTLLLTNLRSFQKLPKRCLYEFLVATFILTLRLIIVVLFHSQIPQSVIHVTSYPYFIAIGWSAIRLGQTLTILLIFYSYVSATAATLLEAGSFSFQGTHANITLMNISLILLSTMGLFLGSIVSMLRSLQRTQESIIRSDLSSYVVVDSLGKITFVSSSLLKELGYSEQELIGQFVEILVPKQSNPQHEKYRQHYMKAPIARAMGGGRDLSIKRKDNTELPVEIGLAPIQIGNKLHILSSIIDISKRKQAELAREFLLEVTKVLSSSLDYSTTFSKVAKLTVPKLADWSLVHLLIDDKLKQVAAAHVDPMKDPLAQELSRLEPEKDPMKGPYSVIKTRKPEIYPDADDSEWVAEVIGIGHSHILNYLGTVSYLCVPLLEKEKAIGTITLVYGESKRRYRHFELDLALELARRAAYSIENSKLYSQAKEAIQIRDDFLAIVTHDLQNPLTAIISSAELAKKMIPPKLNDPLLKLIGIIFSSSKHMERLIKDLVDLAKLEAKHPIIEAKITRVDSIVLAIHRLFDESTKEKGLSFKTNIAENLPPLYCDQIRIIQVLSNLLGNALKFTPCGGSITLTVIQLNEDFIEFAVQDTGPGIAKENLNFLFQKQWQAKETKSLGSGLGLYISKELVQLNGGQIWVKSTLGIGSTFYFTVPIAKQAVEQVNISA